jgi:serine phosphatase RsbU (regulator of sigma subunit)
MARCTFLLRYGVGAFVTALAFLLILMAEAVLQPEFPAHIASPLFLLAVTVSAWYGGKGPGLFTACLSYLTLDFVFLPPIFSLNPGWEDLPLAGLYVLAAIVIATLEGKRRRAEDVVHRSEERMRLARNIQERLWAGAPPSLPEFDIAGRSYPAEAVGGDYFDIIPMRNGRLGLVVGDVSGHGVGSALLISEVRAYLRALVLVYDDLSDILTRANALLVNDIAEGTFVTLFFACLDLHSRSMIFAGAGHEGILLHATGSQERLHSTSLPLGLEKDLVVTSASAIELKSQEVVVMTSDGITEALSRRGDRFGIDRTVEVIRGLRDRTAREMMDVLYQSVRAFTTGMPQSDDQTALIVKVGTRKDAVGFLVGDRAAVL